MSRVQSRSPKRDRRRRASVGWTIGGLIAPVIGAPQALILEERFESLTALSRASESELARIRGIDRTTAARIKAAFTVSCALLQEKCRRRHMDSAAAVANLLLPETIPLPVEHFYALLLDTRRRLLSKQVVATGGVHTILFDSRNLFREAIAAHASSIVIAHNHPSGDPSPSHNDIAVTREIIFAGNVLKIEIVDHVILGLPGAKGRTPYCSLREQRYIRPW